MSQNEQSSSKVITTTATPAVAQAVAPIEPPAHVEVSSAAPSQEVPEQGSEVPQETVDMNQIQATLVNHNQVGYLDLNMDDSNPVKGHCGFRIPANPPVTDKYDLIAPNYNSMSFIHDTVHYEHALMKTHIGLSGMLRDDVFVNMGFDINALQSPSLQTELSNAYRIVETLAAVKIITAVTKQWINNSDRITKGKIPSDLISVASVSTGIDVKTKLVKIDESGSGDQHRNAIVGRLSESLNRNENSLYTHIANSLEMTTDALSIIQRELIAAESEFSSKSQDSANDYPSDDEIQKYQLAHVTMGHLSNQLLAARGALIRALADVSTLPVPFIATPNVFNSPRHNIGETDPVIRVHLDESSVITVVVYVHVNNALAEEYEELKAKAEVALAGAPEETIKQVNDLLMAALASGHSSGKCNGRNVADQSMPQMHRNGSPSTTTVQGINSAGEISSWMRRQVSQPRVTEMTAAHTAAMGNAIHNRAETMRRAQAAAKGTPMPTAGAQEPSVNY